MNNWVECTVLKEKYPILVNRDRGLFQQDKARPHTSRRTLRKLEEFDGVKLLPHPTYSPGLAPFQVNATLSLGKKNKDAVSSASKSKDWYLEGIENFSRQWQRTFDHNGIYFEY